MIPFTISRVIEPGLAISSTRQQIDVILVTHGLKYLIVKFHEDIFERHQNKTFSTNFHHILWFRLNNHRTMCSYTGGTKKNDDG
jgi:hypothetical protein